MHVLDGVYLHLSTGGKTANGTWAEQGHLGLGGRIQGQNFASRKIEGKFQNKICN
jgi:hypothetical protein